MKNICKIIIGILVIIVLLTYSNIAIAVSQTDINNQQNQKDQNNEKINEIKDKEEEIKELKDKTLSEVEKLNSQITEYQGQISQLEAQINEANAKIKEAEDKIAKAEYDYKEQQDMLEQRMVAVYESGETSYLDVLLSSEGITDFISNYYLVSEVTQYDLDLLEGIQKQKEEIEAAKKELETSKQSLTSAKAEKEGVSSRLKTAKSEKDKYISELSAEEKKLQEQIKQLQEDNVAIDKKIQKMQAQIEEARKKAEEEEKNKGQNNGKPSNGGTSSVGFIKPVNSYVTTGMYYSSGSYHGAVDFGTPGINGSPIFAVADGIVVTSENLGNRSYGNYIIIYHPSCNLYTLYAHGQNGSRLVSEGQYVKQGQQIMSVGTTGNSSGPHLHFEVRTSPGYYSNRVNPNNYLPK